MEKSLKWTMYSKRYRLMTVELKRARASKGWTQAYAAHVVGCGRSWIGKIERAELRLDVVQLIHICQCYGISSNRLLRRLEEEPSDEDGSYLSVGTPSTPPVRAEFLRTGGPLSPADAGIVPMRRMANTAVRRDSGSRPHIRTASSNSGGSGLCVHSRVHTHIPPLILLVWVVGSSPSASTISGRGTQVPRFFR